jgi:hypothetical protein
MTCADPARASTTRSSNSDLHAPQPRRERIISLSPAGTATFLVGHGHDDPVEHAPPVA